MNFLKRIFGPSAPQPPAQEDPFDQARSLACGAASRNIVLVRPELSLLALACPATGSMPQTVGDQMEAIVPSTPPRNIAVVTNTASAPEGQHAEVGSAAWTRVGIDLPFFGLLNGLGYIGHTVWIFDASSNLEQACRNADMLIIDSDVSAQITPARLAAARSIMRTPSVLTHDRQSFQLRPLEAPSLNWDAVFDQVHKSTLNAHRLAIVRPDASTAFMSCTPTENMTKDQLAQAHRIIPKGVRKNVAIIAITQFDAADLRAAGNAIPFFGLVWNLACAGNPTWVFESKKDCIIPGSRQADLLIIDSQQSDKIPMKTLDEAAAAMRSPNIAVFDRNSKKIALLKSLSGSMEKLIFND